MPRYLDPKNDFIFKKIFGQHPELLKSFLNAVLPLPEDCVIESLTYLPTENVPEVPALKYSIVDVRCFDNHGRHFIVEMQLQWIPDFIKRMLKNLDSNSTETAKSCVASVLASSSINYTLSRCAPPTPCSSSASANFNLGSLQFEKPQIYGLVLVNAIFSDQEEWFHHYRMAHAVDKNKTLEDLQLVLIELPKLKPTTITQKKLAILWLRFLKEIDEQTREVDPTLLEVAPIKEALHLLEIAAYDDAELLAYDREWDAISSEKTLLSGRFAEGKAEGKAEVAIKLHQLGLSINQIVDATEFTEEQLKQLFSKLD